MATVKQKDFINAETLKTYDDIDGLKVIEELLLTRGEHIATTTRCVRMKDIEDVALMIYNLKVNATNRLHVGMRLDKYFMRKSLVTDSGKIKVPAEIYDRVKEINDRFRNNQTPQP